MTKTPSKFSYKGLAIIVSPSIRDLLAVKKITKKKTTDTEVEVVEYGLPLKDIKELHPLYFSYDPCGLECVPLPHGFCAMCTRCPSNYCAVLSKMRWNLIEDEDRIRNMVILIPPSCMRKNSRHRVLDVLKTYMEGKTHVHCYRKCDSKSDDDSNKDEPDDRDSDDE